MTNELPDGVPKQKLLLTPKRKILLAIAGWWLLSTLETIFLDPRLPASARVIPFLVTSIGFGVLLLAWCKADSIERGNELTSGWKFMLVFLGLFSFVAYLFKTRGFSRGFLALLYTFGFIVAAFVVITVIATICVVVQAMILGSPTVTN